MVEHPWSNTSGQILLSNPIGLTLLVKPSNQTSWSNPPGQTLLVKPCWSNLPGQIRTEPVCLIDAANALPPPKRTTSKARSGWCSHAHLGRTTAKARPRRRSRTRATSPPAAGAFVRSQWSLGELPRRRVQGDYAPTQARSQT